MRSFQKKLTGTAAAAALLAALGAAFAQSSDPLDAHSATADRNANVSQGTAVKDFQGNDMSANGPMAQPATATPSTTATQSSDTTSTTTTTNTDNSSLSSAPATTDNSAASNTTDNSAATDNTPAPRADRN